MRQEACKEEMVKFYCHEEFGMQLLPSKAGFNALVKVCGGAVGGREYFIAVCLQAMDIMPCKAAETSALYFSSRIRMRFSCLSCGMGLCHGNVLLGRLFHMPCDLRARPRRLHCVTGNMLKSSCHYKMVLDSGTPNHFDEAR